MGGVEDLKKERTVESLRNFSYNNNIKIGSKIIKVNFPSKSHRSDGVTVSSFKNTKDFEGEGKTTRDYGLPKIVGEEF